MKLSKSEKKMLINLICQEQTKMIVKDPESYENPDYRNLEKIKVKIKDDV